MFPRFVSKNGQVSSAFANGPPVWSLRTNRTRSHAMSYTTTFVWVLGLSERVVRVPPLYLLEGHIVQPGALLGSVGSYRRPDEDQRQTQFQESRSDSRN